MPAPDLSRLRRSVVCAVVLDSSRRVLLHRRTDNLRWSLPGGAIEVGETAADAVVREAREETGYEVEIVRLVGVYSTPGQTTIRYPEGDVSAYVAISFECRATAGGPTVGDESAAVEWFDARALPPDLYGPHAPRIADALTGQVAAFYR